MKRVSALCVVALAAAFPAAAGELLLNVRSAGDSTFYEHFSDGFFRMDLFSPLQPRNQSFHAISNPDVIYNQNYDGFPNDYEWRFGNVDYDESGLVNGTGLAPITALTRRVPKFALPGRAGHGVRRDGSA